MLKEKARKGCRWSLQVTEGFRRSKTIAEGDKSHKMQINGQQSRDAVDQRRMQKVTEGCRRLKNVKGCMRSKTTAENQRPLQKVRILRNKYLQNV